MPVTAPGTFIATGICSDDTETVPEIFARRAKLVEMYVRTFPEEMDNILLSKPGDEGSKPWTEIHLRYNNQEQYRRLATDLRNLSMLMFGHD